MSVRLLLALCLLSAGCAERPEFEPVRPPNFLFILTDDQGYGDLSLHGNDSIRTPHMDDLLRRGARFTRFYVSPVCAPTRASFLSGMHAPRTGAIFVTRRQETMAAEIETLPELLRNSGYRTALYGKWHNGATFPYHPAGRGFDEFLGFTLGHFNDYFSGTLRNERDAPVPFTGDLTGILTDSAAHFMLDTKVPFFCMVAYQAPHTPVQVADRYWNRVAKRGLTDYNTGVYAMVESIDDRIGQLLATLEAAGVLDNTVVIFASDNGPNGDRYRAGLRGTKGWVDEGGVRVPFAMLLPEGFPGNGKTYGEPAGHVDLLPTLLEMAGVPLPPHLDGRSLLPVLRGDTPAHRYLFAFGQGPEFTGFPGSMRDGRYLYVARDSMRDELYDLDADPGQDENVMGSARGVGERMREAYRETAARVARPDRVAPPVDLAAGPPDIRLLAHEGNPSGATRFSDPYGWANDFFVDVDEAGASWPVTLDSDLRFGVTVHYHLDAGKPVAVRLGIPGYTGLTARLPVVRAEVLPVRDRVPRKEVYPRDWASQHLGEVTLPAGMHRLHISVPGATGPSGLWIKEVQLRRLSPTGG